MILCKTKTPFNDILVTRAGDNITLWSPKGVRQTAISAKDARLPIIEYARNMLLALAFCPPPRSALVLGLGGGSIPMMLFYAVRDLQVEVVEIDPEMCVVAERYFHFKTSARMRLIVDDASLYLRGLSRHFDLVVLDTYLGRTLPRELLDDATISRLRDAIASHGVLVANMMSRQRSHFQPMLDALSEVFGGVFILAGDSSRNVLAFATAETRAKTTIVARARQLETELPFGIPLSTIAAQLEAPKARGTPVAPAHLVVKEDISMARKKRPCYICGQETSGYCDRCMRPICSIHYMEVPGYWADGKKFDRLLTSHPYVNGVVVYCPQCEPRATGKEG